MVEAKPSSETSALTKATWRNIPDDGLLLYINKYCFEMVKMTRMAAISNITSKLLIIIT
jgi:hypothetical protein